MYVLYRIYKNFSFFFSTMIPYDLISSPEWLTTNGPRSINITQVCGWRSGQNGQYFCRQQFWMYFLQWNCLNFKWNFIKMYCQQFQMYFLQWNCWNFKLNVIKLGSLRSSWLQVNIGSGNDSHTWCYSLGNLTCQCNSTYVRSWNKLQWFDLTHWGRVTHICVTNLGHQWFRWWLVACSAPSHYLKQCSIIVNWTLRNKFQSQSCKDTWHQDSCLGSDYRVHMIINALISKVQSCRSRYSVHWASQV